METVFSTVPSSTRWQPLFLQVLVKWRSQAQERQVFWTWVECLNPTSTPETCSGCGFLQSVRRVFSLPENAPSWNPLFMVPQGWWQPLESVTFGVGWRLRWWCLFRVHKKHLEQLLLKPEHPALCQRTTVARLILPTPHRSVHASQCLLLKGLP